MTPSTDTAAAASLQQNPTSPSWSTQHTDVLCYWVKRQGDKCGGCMLQLRTATPTASCLTTATVCLKVTKGQSQSLPAALPRPLHVLLSTGGCPISFSNQRQRSCILRTE